MEPNTINQDIADAILRAVDAQLEVLRTVDAESRAAILRNVAAVIIDKLILNLDHY